MASHRKRRTLQAITIVDAFEDAIEGLLPTEPTSPARIDLLRLLRRHTDKPHGALDYVKEELGRTYIEIDILTDAPFGVLSKLETGRLRSLKEQRRHLEQIRDMLEDILLIVEPVIQRIREGAFLSDEEFYEALKMVALATGWNGPLPKSVEENFANKIAPALES